LVRLNTRRALRRENYLDLLVRILGAKRRIWIENAYFVPDGALIRALKVAAESGVDVKIVVPAISDVFFIPWVTAAFNLGLLRAGVKVFEYNKGMMHAKTVLIDDWGLVGSSNLNHRSLFHDLEADLVLADESACLSQVTLDNWRSRPTLERLIGKVLLLFKGVL
jgi:cardiolipin synthase